MVNYLSKFAPIYSQGETTYGRVQQKLKSEVAGEILSDSEIDEETWEKKGDPPPPTEGWALERGDMC